MKKDNTAQRGLFMESSDQLQEITCASVYAVHDGIFQYVKPQFAEIAGYQAQEMSAMKSLLLIHPDDGKTARGNAIKMLRGRSVHLINSGLSQKTDT